MDEDNTVDTEEEGSQGFTATCEECDRVFTGPNCKGQLSGHMKIHKVKPRFGDRKERVSMGSPERKFNCPSDDGFHYRVFNDNWQKEPGRIQRAKNAGYEIVEGHDQIAVGTNEDGSAIKGVLMRQLQEHYDEDQAAKQKEIDKVDEQIMTGDFKKGKDDKRYSPDGIRIWSGTEQP